MKAQKRHMTQALLSGALKEEAALKAMAPQPIKLGASERDAFSRAGAINDNSSFAVKIQGLHGTMIEGIFFFLAISENVYI